jgi:hypothetical protein
VSSSLLEVEVLSFEGVLTKRQKDVCVLWRIAAVH